MFLITLIHFIFLNYNLDEKIIPKMKNFSLNIQPQIIKYYVLKYVNVG